MNNKFEIVVYWSEEDRHFLTEVPEIPSIITSRSAAQCWRND